MTHSEKSQATKGLCRRLYQILRGETSVVIIVIGLIWLIGFFASKSYESHARQQVDDSLQRALKSASNALFVWREDRVQITHRYAANKKLADLTQQLLAAAPERESLRQSAAQSALKNIFITGRLERRIMEFFILAPDNTYLAASRGEYIGADSVLASQPEILSRLWSGEIPLTKFKGKYDTPDGAADELVSERVALFFAAPIFNADNRVIALLLLRESPFDYASTLFQSIRFGKTGEMFGFDKEGRSLLLAQLNRDVGDVPVITPVQNISALQKGGTNLDGYVDHRGRSVVAAWYWFTHASMGIIALQTEAEAYSNYHFVQRLLYVSCALISLLILVLFFLLQNRHQAMTAARQHADDANRAKSIFLATMSHEIRTPINGIMGMLDVLRRLPPGDENGKMLSTINDSASTLLTLIDEILDFSKVEAGKIELEEAPVTLEDILDGVGQTLLPIAAQKNIDLITFCDPALPQYLADAGRIRQVLYNLVGNAIKFTHTTAEKHGRVMISIEAGESATGSPLTLFKIADNGIGIDAKVQRELFEPFTQAESSIKRKYGGTGLGLTISKRLCGLMGGDILVDSELGAGAVFTMALPLQACSQPNVNHDSLLENTRVLFLTEEDSVCDFISRYLQGERVKLSEAPSTQIAKLPVQQLQGTSELVIIVIETQSYGEDINATLEQLRTQFSATSQPRFVVVSRGRRRAARRTAADTLQIDYSTLSRRAFIDVVSVAAGLASDSTASGYSGRGPETPLPRIVEIGGHADHRLLIAEDNQINQNVLKYQLDLMGLTADIANDGEEALKMWSENRDKYSLLLTDCHMPRMDGYDLSRAIRELEHGSSSRLPIIATTADAMSEARQQCLDAGMDDYICKPLQLEILSAKLASWLPEEQTMGEIQSIEVPGAQDVATVDVATNIMSEVINPGALPELLGSDDPKLLAEFYHEFLTSASPTVQDMFHAIDNGRVKEVSALAHKLKSSAVSVGAQSFYECCLQMENWGKSGDSSALKQNRAKLQLHMQQTRDWILQHYPKAD